MSGSHSLPLRFFGEGVGFLMFAKDGYGRKC